ncbi:ferredoxin-like protein FixX [Desulfitobacterium sp. LBE]|uniref:Ferredoxin-like protein n=2 Tax=root TaxID=1 RepID=B8G0W2_DESHD|nr:MULTISPECIES: 4Fe-4S dicluster domain-containing protein [Desulfitobacterium]ACL18381.1 putative ferredoxin [Desulfitobacterium hafniense DCB-2]MEA5023669.1 4Fe-4S dicluster domain-containing protein [Desulfitobacterium hafniense]TWH58691.1 ferredoxin-like protein FixX [Desulfitobacterium sp. LBE]
MIIKNNVNVDHKLGINKFHVDEENAHIVLKEDNLDMKEYQKLVIACPAGLYKIDEKGNPQFDYAGCLECGTCRVLCGKTIIEKWELPQGTLGIEFRFG